MQRELVRKALHAGLAFGLAVIAPYTNYSVLITLACVLFVLFFLVRVTKRLSIGTVPRVTFGELFFALGILSAALLTWPHAESFQFAMVLLSTADPLASLVGMRFGTHAYMVLDEKRTYEGSLTCFLVSFLVLLFFGVPFSIGMALAGILTVVEAVSLRGSDNLFLPTVGVVLYQLFV